MMIDVVLLLEETGRFALPDPIVETIACLPLFDAANLVVSCGPELAAWADTADVILLDRGRFDRGVELVARPW
jgi:hypothetical protein